MKGLFIASLGRPDEGYDLVKGALKIDLKSHVCWHVYGLLYKTDKNYDEALKCYLNALRFDKENSQILRDVGTLQLQTRQKASNCDTRYQILGQRPVIKANWLGLAMAYYFDGRIGLAVKVLDAMLEGFSLYTTNDARKDIADVIRLKIHMLLKKNSSNKTHQGEDLIKILERNSSLFSAGELMEIKSTILAAQGPSHHQDYSSYFLEAFAVNPESRFLLRCILLGSREADHHSLVKALLKTYPNSLLLTEQCLMLSPDLASLEVDLEETIIPSFNNGRLAYLKIIKQLYKTKKATWMVFILDQQPKTLWSKLLMVLHYSWLEDHTNAIKHLEKFLGKYDGSLNREIFLLVAYVLKRSGLVQRAARCIEVLSLKDPSDRFLNSKNVKYLLRSGEIDKARNKMEFFLRRGNPDKPIQDVVEMQIIWYALELGLAYQKGGNHDKALDHFLQIIKHFHNFFDDQFDFHNYVLRRSTFVDYFDLMAWEDAIYGHPLFAKALISAFDSYQSILKSGRNYFDTTSEFVAKDFIKWYLRALRMRHHDVKLKVSAIQCFLAFDECYLAYKVAFEMRLVAEESIAIINSNNNTSSTESIKEIIGKELVRFNSSSLKTVMKVEPAELVCLDRILETHYHHQHQILV